jgi:hypothetical protein
MSLKPFSKKLAHALNEDERDVVEALFGQPTMIPPSSAIEFYGKYLVIEHFNLQEVIDRYHGLDMRLCAEGVLHFPVK